MDFLKRNFDKSFIFLTIIASLVWMNVRFDAIQDEMQRLKCEVKIIKTVCIMQEITLKKLSYNQSKISITEGEKTNERMD